MISYPEPKQRLEGFTFQGTGEGERDISSHEVQRLPGSSSQHDELCAFIHYCQVGIGPVFCNGRGLRQDVSISKRFIDSFDEQMGDDQVSNDTWDPGNRDDL